MSELVLRDYQKVGVDFLLKNNSAFLADEMGLGKTVQILSAINFLINNGEIKKTIIIVPNSLLSNWEREIRKWVDTNSYKLIQGQGEKKREYQYLLPFYIQLVSYDSIKKDYKTLVNLNLHYDLLVLDEAQKIKNRKTKVHLACSQINSNRKWLMSGTPLENNLDETRNLIEFIKPGIVLSEYSYLDEILNSIDGIILKRKKKDVAKDLPPIIEQTLYLNLSDDQRKEYDEKFRQQLRVGPRDLKKNILSFITQLKLICNFSEQNKSSKLSTVKSIIKETPNDSKIIIFSQYVTTLEKIQRSLEDLNYETYMYHGKMKEKQKEESISGFKNSIEKKSILLISLMAGGVGLNIPEGTHVILYDRWWNPALESQAIARAHRIGKKDNLHVFKFVVSDTIEDYIEELIKLKEDLIDKVDEKIDDISKEITKELMTYFS